MDMQLVVNPKPTPAQIEAGNYKKHHLTLHGLNISIENPKGSVRSGTDKHGHAWRTKMSAHYGYLRGTNGNDDEQIDVFVGPHPESEKVYVINQIDPDTRRFDEHKAIFGVRSEREARELYLSHYEKGWQGLGGIKEKTLEEFKDWLKTGKTNQAIKSASSRSMNEGWIGVDFDGTLAHYDGDHETLGEPIAPMIERVKAWLRQGKQVKVFTARATDPKACRDIEQWCQAFIGKKLPVTNEKDHKMIALWDDRAIRVERNTGAIKALTEKDRENELIRENKKKPEAAQPHRFKPAKWTHGNGHPRCLICGDEPTMSGVCNKSIFVVAIKAIRDLPLLPSKKNPSVRRHQGKTAVDREVAPAPERVSLDRYQDNLRKAGIRLYDKPSGIGGELVMPDGTSASILDYPHDYIAFAAIHGRKPSTPHEETVASDDLMKLVKAGWIRYAGFGRYKAFQIGDERALSRVEDMILGMVPPKGLPPEHRNPMIGIEIISTREYWEFSFEDFRDSDFSIKQIIKRRRAENFRYAMSDKKPPALHFGVGKAIRIVVAPFIVKAIIATPHIPGSNKIDWAAVPVGASIWITVTDESSPLAGRHLLITKRSDNQAVIDPGEARRAGYDVGSWADEAFGGPEGMAHASFQWGQLSEKKKDVEKWAAYEERQKERAPYVEKLREIRRESAVKVKELEQEFIQSVGISKYGLTALEKKTVADTAARQAIDAGLDKTLAQTYGDTVAKIRDQIERRFQRETALRRFNYYQRALENILDPQPEKKPAPKKEPEPEEQVDTEMAARDAVGQLAALESEPLEIEAPEIPLDANTPEEVQQAVAEDLLKKAAQAKKRREENKELREEAKHDAILIRAVEEGEDPLDKILRTQDKDAAKGAVDNFQGLQRALAERREIQKIMPPKLPRPETAVVAQAIESMRLKAVEAVDDEAIKAAEHRYRKSAEMNLDQGFYATLAEHWNDETGFMLNGGTQNGATEYLNGLLKRKKGFVSGAAGAALTALVGKHTDVELDIGRLTDALSPSVAATIVGYWLVDQARKRNLGKRTITGIVDAIERDNMGVDAEGKRDPEKGLLAMEQKALIKNRELQETWEKIQREKNHGELAAEGSIMRREAENILARRENLGNAYGSLSASGQLLLAMKHAQADINERISINVGSSKDNAMRILEILGVKPGRVPPEFNITHNIMGSDEHGEPVLQYQLSGSALDIARRWGQSAPIVNGEAAELEKIKNNKAPVVPTDRPPLFRQEWINDAGEKELFQYRQSQRNDVQYLLKMGGGLITRSTGAGKSLTSLGYIGHLLKENPHSKHLIIVPDGTTNQWLDQGTRATEMNFLAIPEKQTKEARAKLWANVKNGQVVIVSHSDALKAQSDVNAIMSAGFMTCVIDEPQKLKSQASARLGTAARRIINVPFKHRIGLTATPARESLDEIYDWVNWSTKIHIGEDVRGRPRYQPRIGSRVGFGRMYGGMGTGTNAQEEAIQNLIYRKLGSYVSGDEFKVRPNYKVIHNSYTAKRTPAQIEKQKQIEASYNELKAKIEVEEKEKAKRAGKGYFRVKQRVAHRLMKEMDKRHWDNLHGGDKNGKTETTTKVVMDKMKEGKNTQVIFVDTPLQMGSMQRALQKQGISNFYDITELNKMAKFRDEAQKIASAENITLDQALPRVIAQRISQWGAHKAKKEKGIIFIDRTSQAGFNLQKGDSINIAGKPEDAAAMYQIIGRGDRSPREGDLDVSIIRYGDSSFEDAGWQDIEAKKKIVLSITPALAKSAYVGVTFQALAKSIISRRILEFFGVADG